MDVLVTLNSGYVPQLTVMLHSLLEAGTRERVTVYVANSGLTETDFAFLRARLPRERISLVDIRVEAALFAGAPISERYPQEMYYRILAAQYLPETLERVLYLDPDLVVINSIEPLFHMQLGNSLFAAASHVREPLRTLNGMRLGIEEENSPYINSGVMLLNLAGLRREQRTREVFDYIERNRKRLMLPDQDVISALYAGRIVSIDPYRYNLSERIYALYNLRPQNLHNRLTLDWVRKNVSIVHYCGHNKPWREGYVGELDCFYRRYAHVLD